MPRGEGRLVFQKQTLFQSRHLVRLRRIDEQEGQQEKNISKSTGSKKFCSGAGLIDHALVTIGNPKQILLDIDLRNSRNDLQFHYSNCRTGAFKETCTATVYFKNVPVRTQAVIGEEGWYLNRLGFWHGACGPAACWAGGAVGLVDYASIQHRDDPHTMAHLGAMMASTWALHRYLEAAGDEIDEVADTPAKLHKLALTVRHVVEQACTDPSTHPSCLRTTSIGNE